MEPSSTSATRKHNLAIELTNPASNEKHKLSQPEAEPTLK
jgi:hypothetical protein